MLRPHRWIFTSRVVAVASRGALHTAVLPLATVTLAAQQAAPPAAAPAPVETIAIRVSEGTALGFDVSSDGTLVFDLLGQLWLVPPGGGSARAITDAVQDTAEDLDPSFSPDGRRVAFRGERAGRSGLWLLELEGGRLRQLTQLAHPDGYEGQAAWSPDGRVLAYARAMPPEIPGGGRSYIALREVDADTARELVIEGLPRPHVRDPTWVRGRGRIAFVAAPAPVLQGGRVWMVDTAGGRATPVTAESLEVVGAAFSPDGRGVAYFAPDSSGRVQVWVQDLATDTAAGPPRRLTNHRDVSPTRVRWRADGGAVTYTADGRLWTVAVAGGPPSQIPFTAQLTFERPRPVRPPARFPRPGERQAARGFTGLALSPDGRRIGVIALGKLWVTPLGGVPLAVADVPLSAHDLAWAPDGREVVWAAGVAGQDDLFATDLTTRTTRRVTALPGVETFPTYSPDGRHLAFAHRQAEDARLRMVDARARDVADTARTRDLGPIAADAISPPRWSPRSDGLLVTGAADANPTERAAFVPLSGERQPLPQFPEAPLFVQWTAHDTMVYVRHDRVWAAPFASSGMLAEPQPLGTSPALYLSASPDGTLLFVSEGGLRLRSPGGDEQRLGWPISFTPPVGPPLLLRNVRVHDGTGAATTAPRDLLVVRGRIERIARAGTIAAQGAQVIDAGGRVAIPGLIDLHAHSYRPELLSGFLYYGVTTIRDQGSSMAPLVAYADAGAAGLFSGPRIAYGGFQYYSDWRYDDEQGRGVEPEADPDHFVRAVALAEAFGAQHIKTRTFRRWDINARLVAEAHRRGLRATGHCAHQMPLVVAGIDAKEHVGFCEPRLGDRAYDDLVQLHRAAGIAVVPTISYLAFAARLAARPSLLDEDAELASFLPPREAFGWMLRLRPGRQAQFATAAQSWRETTLALSRAGVDIGTGTDIWQVPTAVHLELEELVAAGISPARAIHAGTGAAARILGAADDLGTIAMGKRADLIILDADPVADIRNTRRIWRLVHDGRLVDRAAILAGVQQRAAASPK